MRDPRDPILHAKSPSWKLVSIFFHERGASDLPQDHRGASSLSSLGKMQVSNHSLSHAGGMPLKLPKWDNKQLVLGSPCPRPKRK